MARTAAPRSPRFTITSLVALTPPDALVPGSASAGTAAAATSAAAASRLANCGPRTASKILATNDSPFRCLRGELTGSRRKVALRDALVAIRPRGRMAASGSPVPRCRDSGDSAIHIRRRTSKHIGPAGVALEYAFGVLAPGEQQVVDHRDDVDRLAPEAPRGLDLRRLRRRWKGAPAGLAPAQPDPRRHDPEHERSDAKEHATAGHPSDPTTKRGYAERWMDLGLDGKVALVTAASQGIGYGIA